MYNYQKAKLNSVSKISRYKRTNSIKIKNYFLKQIAQNFEELLKFLVIKLYNQKNN